jgi:hypothetical protein
MAPWAPAAAPVMRSFGALALGRKWKKRKCGISSREEPQSVSSGFVLPNMPVPCSGFLNGQWFTRRYLRACCVQHASSMFWFPEWPVTHKALPQGLLCPTCQFHVLVSWVASDSQDVTSGLVVSNMPVPCSGLLMGQSSVQGHNDWTNWPRLVQRLAAASTTARECELPFHPRWHHATLTHGDCRLPGPKPASTSQLSTDSSTLRTYF